MKEYASLHNATHTHGPTQHIHTNSYETTYTREFIQDMYTNSHNPTGIQTKEKSSNKPNRTPNVFESQKQIPFPLQFIPKVLKLPL